MKRKRIKYVANIDFDYRSITDAKQHIKIFLKSLLSQIGLQSGIDYIVTANHLRIRHVKNITGKITTTLKEIFPVFNFLLEDSKTIGVVLKSILIIIYKYGKVFYFGFRSRQETV